MPQIFLYEPFTNYRDDPTAEKCLEYFQQTGLTCTLLELGGGTPLSVVGNDDLLLIDCHGDIAQPEKSFLVTPSGSEVLTANDLAKQLREKGLARTHQSILMCQCYAGGTSQIRSGATVGSGGVVTSSDLVVKKNKMNECFASVLAKALGQLTYYSILVGGFPGVFSQISYTLNGVSAFQADGQRVRAQLDHIQWFDCKGAPT